MIFAIEFSLTTGISIGGIFAIGGLLIGLGRQVGKMTTTTKTNTKAVEKLGIAVTELDRTIIANNKDTEQALENSKNALKKVEEERKETDKKFEDNRVLIDKNREDIIKLKAAKCGEAS